MNSPLSDPTPPDGLVAGGDDSGVRLEDYLAQASVTVIGPANREEYLDGDVNRDLYPRDEFDKSYDGTLD